MNKDHKIPTEYQDLVDAHNTADSYLNMTRCAGNRLIASGFICPHCDSGDPSKICKKPCEELVIDDEKKVYTVISNSDLTEGKGYQIVVGVTQLEATAIRLSKRVGVQGSNAAVNQSIALRNSKSPTGWLVPGDITLPSIEDKENQKRIDAKKEAIESAKKLGLSEDQIRAIQSSS